MIGCYGEARGINWSTQIPICSNLLLLEIYVVIYYKLFLCLLSSELQQSRSFFNKKKKVVVDSHIETELAHWTDFHFFLRIESCTIVRLSWFIGSEVGGSAGHRPANAGSSPVSPLLSLGLLFGIW